MFFFALGLCQFHLELNLISVSSRMEVAECLVYRTMIIQNMLQRNKKLYIFSILSFDSVSPMFVFLQLLAFLPL